MARTYRGAEHKPDGKYKTCKGMDASPPRAFRWRYATKRTRNMSHRLERLAAINPDAMPVYTQARMPWYT